MYNGLKHNLRKHPNVFAKKLRKYRNVILCGVKGDTVNDFLLTLLLKSAKRKNNLLHAD